MKEKAGWAPEVVLCFGEEKTLLALLEIKSQFLGCLDLKNEITTLS
jgi:hypothetical protein